MPVTTLSRGGYNFVHTDRTYVVPHHVTNQLLHILDQWQGIYPKEPTYVQNTLGIPSLFVRIDGTMSEDGSFSVYEIQEGCAWLGYAGIVNSEFAAARNQIISLLEKKVKLLVPDPFHDDDLWLTRTTCEEANNSDELLMIRRRALNGITKTKRDQLITRSVKPIDHHCDKTYGETLGWWKRISFLDVETLPWHQSFVLKPLRGFGSADVVFWLPHSRAGRSTRTHISSTLKRNGSMYLQHFFKPQTVVINERPHHMLYRPFFGFDARSRRWVPLHGVWTARPTPQLRLHGAGDAVSGPLMLE